MTMRSIMTGLLVAAVVAAGAVWLANRSSAEAEVQPVGHAPGPVATDDAMTHPGPEPSRTSDLPGPAPVEIDPPEPALPADVQDSARRGELTDAPEPDQGSTSTR